MIMARLKQETRVYHEQLEANPYSRALMDGTLSRTDYRVMLERFYGFYLPLEMQLHSMVLPSLNLYERMKTPLLLRDLQALGSEVERLTPCTDVPTIDTPQRALGVLYVVEGATLGGQLIARQLKRMGLDAETGAAFFSSYGANVGEMWKAFFTTVNSYAAMYGGEDSIVAAASETFVQFERWLTREPAVNGTLK